MKISLIIPVYNVSEYLEDCLNSVISQNYGSFEVICVNDGSTDNSLQILEKYASKDERIKIINQENQGLSCARNSGIKAASGDYLVFLDSDDWIEPNTLEILSKSVSDEDFIAFNGRRYFEDGTVEEPDEGVSELELTGWDYYNKYALKPHKFHFVCAVLRLYKREFILKNNLFFEKGIYHEDNLFTPIACYYAQKVKVIPDSLYVYRIREDSISQTANKKRILDLVHVANKLSEFFIPKRDIDKSVVYREIAGEFFKGFLSEERKIYGKNDKELKQKIEWESFKSVAQYPRHKRIYFLLRVNPIVFRIYLYIEKQLKSKNLYI